MKELILTSKVPPSVNNYLNYRVASTRGKRFVQAYPSRDTREFEASFQIYVEDKIKNQSWTIPEKGKIVYVEFTFYLERKRKDPNNFLKVPIDVMTKAGVWLDDDVVLPICKRVYIDSENPRLEIKVYESDSIGVFENEEQHLLFKLNNCNLCKKKTSSCSIYKKLIDNRVIKDADNKRCKKKKAE